MPLGDHYNGRIGEDNAVTTSLRRPELQGEASGSKEAKAPLQFTPEGVKGKVDNVLNPQDAEDHLSNGDRFHATH
ncbi:hypothetical protein IPG41_04195 [Candidatus Peregrinibacteria bacterium]|nr:MAG: hypothetical protein IPG41_04195 [Candidatus Peregrinibacteria bacterium]